MAWFVAMLWIYGLAGALVHYLHTGQRPEGWKDVFYPMGADGERRIAIIGYFPDLVAWSTHPLTTAMHKVTPLLTILYDTLWANEDFWGTAIRNPQDAIVQQLQDVAAYVAEEYKPIPLQNAERVGKPNATVGDRVREWATNAVQPYKPAPAAINRSAAENYLHDVRPPTHRTTDQAERAQVRRQLAQGVTDGDPAGVGHALETGALSGRSIRATVRSASQSSLQRAFTAATLEHALRAYELATPEERATVLPLLAKKYHDGFKLLPPNQQLAIAQRFAAVVALPVTRARAAGE
jgi:hypothetical protein